MESNPFKHKISVSILSLICIVSSCSSNMVMGPIQSTATQPVQPTATPLTYTLPVSSLSTTEQLLKTPIKPPYFMWAVEPSPGATVPFIDIVGVTIAPAAIWEPGVGSSEDFDDDIEAGYVLILDDVSVPRVHTHVSGYGVAVLVYDKVTEQQRSFAGELGGNSRVRLTPGIHLAKVIITLRPNRVYTYTWAFRVDPSAINTPTSLPNVTVTPRP